MIHRFGRRGFLVGATGALIAIPVLEELSRGRARAQLVAPKRLVVMLHNGGRMAGNGRPDDLWSPGSATRPLTAGVAPSMMLAALAPIADRIVTIDGVDNLIRHASGDGDGHFDADRTLLTCTKPVDGRGGDASFDYVAGLRLRSGASQPASLVVPLSATPVDHEIDETRAWGAGGTPATKVSGNPREAIDDLFARVMPTGSTPPPAPTLAQRLARRRATAIDESRATVSALRGRVSQLDRDRLDRHLAMLDQIAMGLGSTTIPMGAACAPPSHDAAPHVVPETYDEFTRTGDVAAWRRGRSDSVTIPFQIDNVVQAFACDVTRSLVLRNHDDPAWPDAFGGASPFEADGSVHTAIHATPRLAGGHGDDLMRGFQTWGGNFTRVVTRLGETPDVDGRTLLDNTLVVWMSEHGYGSEHETWNLPIVMAGMPDAFARGQGRHLVTARRSTGDLYAKILRMLGGTDETYGPTGTIGSLATMWGNSNLQPDYGCPGFISASTPLHAGDLDL